MITNERKLFYINLIKDSFSLREVCLKAGIVVTTGNYDTLKRIIKEENIDISHFKRQNVNNQTHHEIDYFLQKGSNIGSFKLKNKLFDNGLKERKCECCGGTEWMGKPINLQLHHINGDNKDNRLENLQILCPNCHSYTDNYCGKNQKTNIKEKERIIKKRTYIDVKLLQECLNETNDLNIIGEKLNRTPKTIKKYIKQYNLKIETKEKKPHYDVNLMFQLMKRYKNYTKVGEKMGISDNAVKKRFIKLGYPSNIKDLLNSI